MSFARKFVTASAIAVALSALLARVHPYGDAGLFADTPSHALPQSLGPARDLLTTKCADCHSNSPNTPIYGHFAPISWLLEGDIVNARKAMNLSQWDKYTPDQQQTYIAKMVQETKAHEMPLPQYRMIHWNTRITPTDIQILQNSGRVAPIEATASATLTGDPVAGQQVFEKRCTGCHSLTQDREGPRLGGVYGRTSGTIHGFTYSPALLQSHMVWDAATLDRWLTDPDVAVPGNNMDFRVAKPQERQDLIAFFKQSAGR